MELEKQVSEWLRSCGVVEVIPVQVTIGQYTYAGARYWQLRYHNDQPYMHEAIYLVGKLPSLSSKKKLPGSECYPFDNRDWFVAGYHQNSTVQPEFVAYHPFGGWSFVLCPWSVPSGEAIDRYSPKPYRRIPMVVTGM